MGIDIIIREIFEGQTVKTFLKKQLLMSGDIIRKLKNSNGIKLNGISVFTSEILHTGDNLTVYLDCGYGNSDLYPYKADLKILYEDPWLLIVDKLPKLVVHPLTYNEKHSLANIVRSYQIEKKEEYTIRPVSRLDKDTSGAVIFAKNQYIQHVLQLQGKDGLFCKEYLALVEGIVQVDRNMIKGKIARKKGSIIEREVSETGKAAITEYDVIKRYNSFSLLKVKLHTGRTHQIRVHMSSIGHPIVGDDLYGACSHLAKRQCLHANKVMFMHPITRKYTEIKSFLPKDIKDTIKFDII